MKPKIRFLIFINIFILITTFQVRSQITVGVIGGVNFQSLAGDAPDNTAYSGKTGYMFGISGEANLTKDLKIMFQPNYSHTQTAINFDAGEEYKDSLIAGLNFYRFPVLLKVEALNGVTYFLSGLDLGILKDAKINDVNKSVTERDITKNIESVDLAALFGVGVKFKIKKINLSLEGRYSQSLLNQSKDNQGELFNNLPSRFRQAGFQFLTYISFNL